ncbi:exopolysaccharide biosynthesis polyprenyl glycosylphosphotransferase [Cognataquiflexum rubidum]|uniref:exopolysaccharide biosynthesis polyprenyl glycosylphosphotransferase n=1 Tax=Cognataquiflexum rubidum TaxID=2922273 RepID=UPI001F141B94|nr:exopolysaccharide biosynthesis polyprenyl glycosylphosphotransferase [Cognataquiflexum rubidum]MCH6234056.1 exopolysaccharide biosynthesis polyprenyl glycosylphosphotransferase [Cognataquiflexum rubidum]
MSAFSFTPLSKYQYSAIIPLMLLVSDFVIVFFFLQKFNSYFFESMTKENILLVSVTLCLCWLMAGFFTSAFQIEKLRSVKGIMIRVGMLTGVFFLFAYALVIYIPESPISLLSLTSIGLSAFLLITVIRVVMFKAYKFSNSSSLYRKRVVIIGASPQTKQLANHFQEIKGQKKYLGYFDNILPVDPLDMVNYLGGLDKVKVFCLENQIHEIYCVQDVKPAFLQELIRFSDENFILLGIIPNVDGMDFDRKLDTLIFNNSKIPVILSRKAPLRRYLNATVKRAFDIVFSSIILLVLGTTLFPLVALAIRFTSPGPLFFKQLRSGKNNKSFYCLKFRSMVVNDQADTLQATDNDPRITKIGALIRKTNIDELPQFINVLKGEMSVVGPRPHMLKHTVEYSALIDNYMLRHHAIPGVTGWAQINGYRGETTEHEAMINRVEADIWYLENWSLYLDMKIILHTVWLSAFPQQQSQFTPKMDMVLK